MFHTCQYHLTASKAAGGATSAQLATDLQAVFLSVPSFGLAAALPAPDASVVSVVSVDGTESGTAVIQVNGDVATVSGTWVSSCNASCGRPPCEGGCPQCPDCPCAIRYAGTFFTAIAIGAGYVDAAPTAPAYCPPLFDKCAQLPTAVYTAVVTPVPCPPEPTTSIVASTPAACGRAPRWQPLAVLERLGFNSPAAATGPGAFAGTRIDGAQLLIDLLPGSVPNTYAVTLVAPNSEWADPTSPSDVRANATLAGFARLVYSLQLPAPATACT